MDTITVGRHEEKILLDYMGDSTVAQLMFDLDVVRIIEKKSYHSAQCARRDANEQAAIVRAKVYKAAFKALRANRRKA